MSDDLAQLNEGPIRVYEKIGRVEQKMKDRSRWNLTIHEIHVLEKIYENPATSVGELEQRLGVTTATATVCVQKLQRKGFVQKDRCDRDLRAVGHYVIGEGLKVVWLHRLFHRRMVKRMTKEFSEQEREALLSGLLQLDGHLIQVLDAPASPRRRERKAP
ncbi:hypothetical protein ABB02_01506 [Clostridiaceae bacterium JG1575]|nr:hypothetical protein ABB02_01506 [Clostridiaceae bacterium JG1575]